MTIITRDYTDIKVVQATHLQGDNECGTKRSILRTSCFSKLKIVQSPGLWGKFHLHCLLGKENQLFILLVNLDIFREKHLQNSLYGFWSFADIDILKHFGF